MNPLCLVALLPFTFDPPSGEERTFSWEGAEAGLAGGEPTFAPARSFYVQDDVASSTFDYEYLDAAFVLGDLDGVRVGGSFPVGGPWVALGRFEYLTDDDGAADVDLLLVSGGAGYIHTVQQDLDFIGSAELEYGEVEVDNPGNDAEDDDLGLRLRGGVRYRVDEKFELAGGMTVRTIFDEDLGLDAMALYSFTDSIQGFVGLDVQDDTFGLFGVRFGL